MTVPQLLERFETIAETRISDAFGLTRRETEVLSWVAQGKSNFDIATILGASPRTVQKHLERIFQKLGVETRTAAAAKMLHLGSRAA
jgi:DNA-binding CsgD family transcriptional regulator